MLKINNVKLSVYDDQTKLKAKICKLLKVNTNDVLTFNIIKKNIDARKPQDICFIYQVAVELTNENKVLKRKLKNVQPYKMPVIPKPVFGEESLKKPIIVVGFGPSGLFCAYELAKNNYPVIVLEQGSCVAKRQQDIKEFEKTHILNERSNIQFGEGGAGTFSDGKLTARSKDVRVRQVYQTLIEFGANEDIMYEAYPHVGTDQLQVIIPKMRQYIIEHGGQILFDTKMEKLIIENDQIRGVITDTHGDIKASNVVLAIGNSSRDTFVDLNKQNIAMEAKPFSIGVRVEHHQKMIDEALYHEASNASNLHAASYRLTHQCGNGKGVYTFCMCPGGEVVAATSIKDQVCVNGMSYYARDQINANSAVLVQVDSSDYGEGLFAGMDFQNELERKAYELGKGEYKAPVQLVKDFINHHKSTEIGNVKPSYALGYTLADLHELFPPKIAESLIEGLKDFDHKIKGFSTSDAIMSAVETRTSSPVRILRDMTSLQSISHKNLYPCGEGCGYAGGIVSSAIDGIRVAQKIMSNYKQPKKDSCK